LRKVAQYFAIKLKTWIGIAGLISAILGVPVLAAEPQSNAFRVDTSKLIKTKYKARIIRQKGEKDQLPELHFNSMSDITIEFEEDTQVPYILISGAYSKLDETVLLGNNRVPLEPSKDPAERVFAISIPLTRQYTVLQIAAINPYGIIRQEKIYVEFQNWTRWLAEKEVLGIPQPTKWSFALGASMISYQETLAADLSQYALTIKGGYGTSLTPRISIAVGGYYTLLPLTSTEPGKSIRFLGVNGRLGFRVPWPPKPWTLSLMFGGYYTTTTSTPTAEFGFTNMAGPQVFPVLSRALSKRSLIGSYFKYSAVAAGFNIIPVGSELAGGINYSYRLRNNNNLLFSVDAAQLKINIQEVLDITSRSLSFSVGLGF
jgi:hypothetical protein